MKWTKGDTVPLNFKLQWDDGTYIDLTGSTVILILTDVDTDIVYLTSSVIVISAIDGQVQYQWGAGETDDVGLYKMEWKITYSTGKDYTVPNAKSEYIHIR